MQAYYGVSLRTDREGHSLAADGSLRKQLRLTLRIQVSLHSFIDDVSALSVEKCLLSNAILVYSQHGFGNG